MIRKEFYEDLTLNQQDSDYRDKNSRTSPNIQSFKSNQQNNFSNERTNNVNSTFGSVYSKKNKQDLVIVDKKSSQKQARQLANTTPSRKSRSPINYTNNANNRKTPNKEDPSNQKYSPNKESGFMGDYQMVKLSYFQSPFVKKTTTDQSQNKLKDLPDLARNSPIDYPSSEKKEFSKNNKLFVRDFVQKPLRSESDSISREVSADAYFRGYRVNSNVDSNLVNNNDFKIKSSNRGYNTDSITKNKDPKTIEFNKELESQSFVNKQNQAINEISSLYITNSTTSPQKKFGVGVELKKYGNTINKEKNDEKQSRFSDIKPSSIKKNDSLNHGQDSVKKHSSPSKQIEMIENLHSHDSPKKNSRKSVTRESSHSKIRKSTMPQKTFSSYEVDKKKVNPNAYDAEDVPGIMSEKIHASNTKNSSHTENLSFKTNGKTNSTLFNSWCLSDNIEIKAHVKHFFTTLMKSFESSSTLSNNNSGFGVSPTNYNSSELQWIVYQQLEELIVSFDDLEIDKQIAQGGNSLVFLGTYRFCDVAIKRMCLNMMTLKEIKQVLTEIACMKKIRHPNIAMIIGISIDTDDYLYMVLEYYQHLSMEDFYKKNKGKIKLISKISILFDIAKALCYLHYNKPMILHRDQKPQNIFIGQDKKPKLGDFGLAKGVNENDSNDVHNTETTATVNYMSPESMCKSIYTEKSDIYSFGITCWEFIHESEAFGDLKDFELIQSIVILKKRPPIDQRLSDGIKALITDCWDDNPEKRPNSKELCFRLKKIILEMKQS